MGFEYFNVSNLAKNLYSIIEGPCLDSSQVVSGGKKVQKISWKLDFIKLRCIVTLNSITAPIIFVKGEQQQTQNHAIPSPTRGPTIILTNLILFKLCKKLIIYQTEIKVHCGGKSSGRPQHTQQVCMVDTDGHRHWRAGDQVPLAPVHPGSDHCPQASTGGWWNFQT